MKKKLAIIAALLPFILIFITHCSHETREIRDISDYCPKAGEVEGWHPEGEAQRAKGEDLFLLINGGAEIYEEYGFKQALYQTYSTDKGQSINLEIYEMNNPESAYGIYTFKTGKSGKSVEVGHEGWLESYYLNFWKGSFLVTLIGLDSGQETMGGLVEIAKTVARKIRLPLQRPQIRNYLPQENLKENGITYIKGNLGLYNQYEFDNTNIFCIKEGIIGDYGAYSVFIFRYKDQEESLKWFEFSKKHLRESNQFNGFVSREEQFSVTDKQGRSLTLKPYQHTILIISGARNADANYVFDLLEKQISN